MNGVDIPGSTAPTQVSAENTLDYGVTFGGGVEFPLSPTLSLFVDGRYSIGMADTIPAANKLAGTINVTRKTSAILALAGLAVGF